MKNTNSHDVHIKVPIAVQPDILDQAQRHYAANILDNFLYIYLDGQFMFTNGDYIEWSAVNNVSYVYPKNAVFRVCVAESKEVVEGNLVIQGYCEKPSYVLYDDGKVSANAKEKAEVIINNAIALFGEYNYCSKNRPGANSSNGVAGAAKVVQCAKQNYKTNTEQPKESDAATANAFPQNETNKENVKFPDAISARRKTMDVASCTKPFGDINKGAGNSQATGSRHFHTVYWPSAGYSRRDGAFVEPCVKCHRILLPKSQPEEERKE